jgi:hypothetical protein
MKNIDTWIYRDKQNKRFPISKSYFIFSKLYQSFSKSKSRNLVVLHCFELRFIYNKEI